MPNVKYTWFSIDPIENIDVIIPNDIAEVICKSESIKRLGHPDYPKNVFADNVKAHIFRLVQKALVLKLDQDAKINLIRMLWIHDIPEIYIESDRDITSVEKESNPELAKNISDNEDEIAHKVLSLKDQELYKEFEMSKDALKTGIINKDTTFIGLIAKILDTTDGNMSFHYYISDWVQSNSYDSGKLPPENALTYNFRFTDTARNNISKLNLNKLEVEFLLNLIQEHVNYIRYVWHQVGSEKTPQALKEGMLSI